MPHKLKEKKPVDGLLSRRHDIRIIQRILKPVQTVIQGEPHR